MTYSIRVGALLRREVRRYLKRVALNNPSASWSEDKGFLDSEFLVSGDDAVVLGVQRELHAWAEKVNAEAA